MPENDAAARAATKLDRLGPVLTSDRIRWRSEIIRHEQDAEGVADRIVECLVANCLSVDRSRWLGISEEGKNAVADLIRKGRTDA